MADYTFITDQGWRVTQYCAFSPSYAVLHTPGLTPPPRSVYDQTLVGDQSAREETPTPPQTGNLLGVLTGQQLKFDYFSEDVLKQLLLERAAIHDRNRSVIQGRLTDLSGDIYAALMLRCPDGDKRRQTLERTKLDLEKQLRDESVTLWRDTLELRKELILAAKKYAGTRIRTGLFAPTGANNDNYQGQGDDHVSG